MKYVQINSFYNGSTGTIMRNLHKELKEQGVDSYIFWGRRHETISDHEACCASKLGVCVHGILSRVTDRAGFYSKRDTRKLLKRLDKIDPDVVHLHNIHGYYINIEMLFEWLASHRCQVKWTLHDCWAFTGHCSHFTFVGCDRWKTRCFRCPQIKDYPKSVYKDSSARNYEDKRRIFNLVPRERMMIIVPSEWLSNLTKASLLSLYDIKIVRNPIDETVFKSDDSNFQERSGSPRVFTVLGVASPWTERKGLNEFFHLATLLPEDCRIVMVGLNGKQISAAPAKITGMPRCESQKHLAVLYRSADLFVNPSIEETFSLTVAEALACGTKTLVRNNTACAEFQSTLLATTNGWSEKSLLDSILKEYETWHSETHDHHIEDTA